MIYSCSLEGKIILGAPSKVEIFARPNTSFRPDRIFGNIPAIGFLMLESILLGNIDILHTAEVYSPRRCYCTSPIDAKFFFEKGRGYQGLYPLNPDKIEGIGGMFPDRPLLVNPANKIRIIAYYTGLILPSYTVGSEYPLIISFQGNAEKTVIDVQE